MNEVSEGGCVSLSTWLKAIVIFHSWPWPDDSSTLIYDYRITLDSVYTPNYTHGNSNG